MRWAIPARRRSVSSRVRAAELGEAARHRDGRVDRRQRRVRHLELEAAVEQRRLLARRLRQDQEELVGAARVPERRVAARGSAGGPVRRTRPVRHCRRRAMPVRLLIAPKLSRSTWIRQSGRPWRRAALISRGSASSKALALPRPGARVGRGEMLCLQVAEARSARRARPARDHGEQLGATPRRRRPGGGSRRRASPPRAGRRGPSERVSAEALPGGDPVA